MIAGIRGGVKGSYDPAALGVFLRDGLERRAGIRVVRAYTRKRQGVYDMKERDRQ